MAAALRISAPIVLAEGLRILPNGGTYLMKIGDDEESTTAVAPNFALSNGTPTTVYNYEPIVFAGYCVIILGTLECPLNDYSGVLGNELASMLNDGGKYKFGMKMGDQSKATILYSFSEKLPSPTECLVYGFPFFFVRPESNMYGEIIGSGNVTSGRIYPTQGELITLSTAIYYKGVVGEQHLFKFRISNTNVDVSAIT